MTTVLAPADLSSEFPTVPLKCKPEQAANVPDNPCVRPGEQLRCRLCPASPSYWRRTEIKTLEGVA
ncbi:hypothetical protein GCM10010172_04640 [Paractinoplanes ferrugineus]|uniref:Uncharacterized protein n=1 Tax=Paractinoplanes ferrugineus TaxID=113564 RepID=A0A919MJ92_9ACTN|nr:hypothetical protein [Actinoplanes ferrugineus]GIE16849.1 hypothetical protein Afe05nite_86890 [Actinoplanes ferrugineus]